MNICCSIKFTLVVSWYIVTGWNRLEPVLQQFCWCAKNENWNHNFSPTEQTATESPVATGCSPVRFRFFAVFATGLSNTTATVLQQANTEAPMSFMLQAKRSTTPIPANDAPSVAFAAVVEHPKTRTELLRLNDTEDVSWCPEVPINIDEDMSELSYMDEPAPGDIPEYPQHFKTPTMATKVIPETPNMLLGTAGSPQHTETATE